MTTIQEIEQAVSHLSSTDLAVFRDWFDEFEAIAWDKQIEADAKSGKLDRIAEKAVADYNAGNYKEL